MGGGGGHSNYTDWGIRLSWLKPYSPNEDTNSYKGLYLQTFEQKIGFKATRIPLQEGKHKYSKMQKSLFDFRCSYFWNHRVQRESPAQHEAMREEETKGNRFPDFIVWDMNNITS